MNVDLYADISCPWCYLAGPRWTRVLEVLDPPEPVVLRHRPFQLNSNMPVEPIPLLDYYRMRGGEPFVAEHLRAQEVVRAAGLPIDMSRALAVNTFDAHRMLWIAARDLGSASAEHLHAAVTREFFAEGANVADHAVLAALAARGGADEAAMRQALDGDTGAAEVRAQIAAAAALGIHSVPTAVIDGKGVLQGALSRGALSRALRSGGYAGMTAHAGHAARIESTPE